MSIVKRFQDKGLVPNVRLQGADLLGQVVKREVLDGTASGTFRQVTVCGDLVHPVGRDMVVLDVVFRRNGRRNLAVISCEDFGYIHAKHEDDPGATAVPYRSMFAQHAALVRGTQEMTVYEDGSAGFVAAFDPRMN